jgi:hypothetical protein
MQEEKDSSKRGFATVVSIITIIIGLITIAINLYR